jgi:multiple sugar transport system permease protein
MMSPRFIGLENFAKIAAIPTCGPPSVTTAIYVVLTTTGTLVMPVSAGP